MTKLKPIHPGEILREEFVVPFGLNPNRLALALRVPPPSIYEIVKEERGISSEMALRLARFFSTTPEFWMNLQTRYDLSISRRHAETKIKRDVHPLVAMK
jgi:addiction module HigA family antidote